MCLAWLIAIGYSIPSFLMYTTVELTEGDHQVAYCMNTATNQLHIIVMINFLLWYCLPLLLMSFMYAKIAVVLWKSGEDKNTNTEDKQLASDCTNETVKNGTESRRNSKKLFRRISSDWFSSVKSPDSTATHGSTDIFTRRSSHHSQNVITSRRKVIRLLLAIVVSFAICMLPHHVRLLAELWIPITNYHPSFLHHLVPPFTFWLFYLNSALNPILYAFLSNNFRQGLTETFRPKRKLSIFSLRTGSRSSRNEHQTYA